jgi:hypothetical protein
MLIGSIFVFGLFANAQLQLPASGETQGGAPVFNNSRGVSLAESLTGVVDGASAPNSQAFLDAAPPGIVGYFNAAADDFTVPACEAWSVSQVNVAGHYFNIFDPMVLGPAVSMNVFIFSANPGAPGDVDLSTALHVYEELSYTDIDQGDFEIPLDSDAILNGGAAGTDYWIVVQANMAFLNGGQWGWTISAADLGNSPAVWQQDFSGVLGTASCVDSWSGLNACGVDGGDVETELAFELVGEIMVKGITATPATLDLTEGSTVGTFWVVLDAPPCDNVDVTIGGVDASEVSLDQTVLNFTPTDWFTAQPVVVTPLTDGVNDGPIDVTLTTTGSSVGDATYSGLAGNDVVASVNNIDGVAVLIVDMTIVAVTEGGAAATVTVSTGADNPPDADVTITLGNPDILELTLSAPSIMLTAGNGYSNSFTISANTDDFVEVLESLTVTTTSTSGGDAEYDGLAISDVNVDITSINVAEVIVTPSATPIQLAEGSAATGTVTYTLSGDPEGDDVTFTAQAGDIFEGAVAGGAVVLNSGNWNSGVVVTVSSLDEFFDDGDVDWEVVGTNTSSVNAGWDGLSVDPADANTTDNDTAGITPTPAVMSIAEGASAVFNVVLDAQPAFDVTFAYYTSASAEALISDGINPPATFLNMTFTTGNWNVNHPVTVHGQIDDVEADGDQLISVYNGNVTSGDPAFEALGANVGDVAVTVTDVDPAAAVIVTAADPIALIENGPAGTFTVVLQTKPTATVTIPIGDGDTDEVSVNVDSLTFIPTAWNVAQTVTVTPVHDGIVDPNAVFSIVNGPASGGNYDGLAVDAVNVTVENIDFCDDVIMIAIIGETLKIYGTPNCVLDLYDCATVPAGYVTTFTLDATGYRDTGIVVGPDACYEAFITLTNTSLGTPVRTVPTLGEWGMIAMIGLLMMAGVIHIRRRRMA